MWFKLVGFLLSIAGLTGFLSLCLWWASPQSFVNSSDRDVDVESERSGRIVHIERYVAMILSRTFLVSSILLIVVYLFGRIHG